MRFKRIAQCIIALSVAAASAVFAADDGSSNKLLDTPQVRELQERMMGDEEVMALVAAMQNDPEVQALLADPKFMEAVQAGDLGALLNDPRVMKLLNNPRVREIGKRLGNRDAGGDK